MIPNRRQILIDGSTAVGIDFIEVDPATLPAPPPTVVLYVYFLGDPGDVFGAWPPAVLTTPESVSIHALSPSSTRPVVPVEATEWTTRNDRRVLKVTVDGAGDFSRYALTLVDTAPLPRIDPFYNDVAFRFQAGCPSDLDCAPAETPCPPVDEPDVPVDYTARDFDSFRRALMEFASLRWPAYADRLEADVGVMIAEVLCVLADEMAYYQDRVAREASWATLTQRRSARHHARLLDYELHDGLAAWTWLQITPPADVDIQAGAQVGTTSIESADNWRLVFEVGRGLKDTLRDQSVPLPESGAMPTRALFASFGAIPAWIWDEDETCLEAGSTVVSVGGQWASVAPKLYVPGVDRWIALRTTSDDSSVPARAHVVRLIGAQEVWDPLQTHWVTRLRWSAAEATPFDMDLEKLTVHGNVVPAVAGRTVTVFFSIGEPTGLFTSPVRRAIERRGPDDSITYLLPLDESEFEPLCFVGEDAAVAVPEVRVDAMDNELDPLPTRWEWRRTMAGSPSALPTDRVFTLEDGLWSEVVRYHGTAELRHFDYRTSAGFTARFGDGSLGAEPIPGTVFRVTYRVGGGTRANLAANTLVKPIDAPAIAAITAVTNPLAVTSGVDAQELSQAREFAREAWKAIAFRAVRPEDYAEALSRLEWVQRAGAKLRWTGSWLTVFATPDPRDSVSLSSAQRAIAAGQLDRFRQAGRETHVLEPSYAWLDLRIDVCVEPESYRGAVEASVLEVLFAPERGFFDPDRFSFGDPLRRSALQAAIQAVPGVRAVERIQVRRRGHFDWRDFTDATLDVRLNEVIGVANDPLFPERGAVSLSMEGGA